MDEGEGEVEMNDWVGDSGGSSVFAGCVNQLGLESPDEISKAGNSRTYLPGRG
jgi:hypothetical protein